MALLWVPPPRSADQEVRSLDQTATLYMRSILVTSCLLLVLGITLATCSTASHPRGGFISIGHLLHRPRLGGAQCAAG